MRPAALLFDLDGTLALSFAAIGRALNAALREGGFPARTREWVRTHVGRGAAVLVREAAGEGVDPQTLARLARRFDRAYAEVFCEQTPPVPGARDVLARAFAATGGRVAVVSNKFERYSRTWLARWGLAAHVAAVVGPDTFGARKPAAAAVWPVLRGFSVEPADALLVGDMAVDVATGAAVGMPVVCVRGEGGDPHGLRRAGALAVLADLRDLPAWLAGNGSGWR